MRASRPASKAFLAAPAKSREAPRPPNAKPKKAAPQPFSVRKAIFRAAVTLATPPARPHTRRVEPVGDLAYRFVLPLPLVAPQNRTHGKTWMLGKLKAECLAVMRSQLVARPTSPLSGRPQVLCVRFSSRETDAYSDGFKSAIDRLKDLGIIVDDKPRCIDLHQWCEVAKPGEGFGLIEVFTGAEL